jgi:hypothetical protein
MTSALPMQKPRRACHGECASAALALARSPPANGSSRSMKVRGRVTGGLLNGVGLLIGSLRPSWTINRAKKSPGQESEA